MFLQMRGILGHRRLPTRVLWIDGLRKFIILNSEALKVNQIIKNVMQDPTYVRRHMIMSLPCPRYYSSRES